MSSPVQLQSQLSAIDVALSVLRQSLAAAVPGSTDQTQLSIAIFDLEQQRSDVTAQLANFTQAPPEAPLSQLATESVEAQPVVEASVTAPAPVDDFVRDPDTGEQVPSDSDRAAEIRAEQNRVEADAPAPAADPYSGLTPEQIELLGGADPTDPFIRARLGLPPLGLPVTDAPAPVGDQTDSADGQITPGQTDPAAGQITRSPAPVGDQTDSADGQVGPPALTPEQQAANNEAAARLAARNQATINSVYKNAGSSDWRVRLQLSATSNYLYNVPQPNDGSPGGPGILAPLAATNGVIFPYTPAIQTTYRANYVQSDLVHSNYRGVFYTSSRVDDINIKGKFTAQDTSEADYLLAVIHFFRSVTKMFYGQDDQRGTPPPLVYLSGLGTNQFYGHPCLVAQFNYSLPDNVDYIRATNVNNYGTDLLRRRTPSKSSSAQGLGATGNRLLNAGLAGFGKTAPAAPTVVGTVNNTQLANYVPTVMDIDLVLIPVQTRSQVSKQFSLKDFASGDLIKKGFW